MAGATIRRFAAKFKKKRYGVERKAGFGLRTRLGVGEVPIDHKQHWHWRRALA
jgi:hypothetical protein